MWFGTKDGLNRYDGLSFRKFKHDGRSQQSIGNSFITALYEDAEGNIWVGTDVGLYIYYPEHDSFRHFEELSVEDTKIEHTVTAIVGDDQGCVWIAVESQGLFCYDLEKEQLQNYTLKNFPFISTNVQSFVFDNSGTLWIGCYGDGLFYSKDRLKTLQPYISPVDNKETFENDVVTTLVKGAYNWLLLIMNCGLGQNRGFISIISGWVNMSIFVVQSMILILFQIMPSIHCVKIAKEEFGLVLISEE